MTNSPIPAPYWVQGNEVAAPAASTQIIKITTTINKIGVVYGYLYASQEAAAAGKVGRLRLNIGGTAVIRDTFDIVANMPPVISTSPLAVLQGNGVDFIEIINVVAATAATIHKAKILYLEIDITQLLVPFTGFPSS